MISTYNVAEFTVFAFCVAVLAHTLSVLNVGGAGAITSSPVAFQMAQDLVHFRAGITGGLLSLYLYFRFTKRPVAKVIAVVSIISWVAFIEDYLALDNIFYLPDSMTGKSAQILRPLYLVAIVYMAVEAYRREHRYG